MVEKSKTKKKVSSAKKVTSKSTSSKKPSAKKPSVKKVSSNKISSKKPTVKKAASKKAVIKKVAKNASTKNIVSGASSKKNVSEKYSIELLRISKNINSVLKIEDIDMKFESGDITAIFSNEPKIELVLASIIAGIDYADKGVIGISENLVPTRDFLYVDSDSALPNDIGYDFYTENIVMASASNKKSSNNKKDSGSRSKKKTEVVKKNLMKNFSIKNLFNKGKNFKNNLSYSYIDSVVSDISGYSKYKLIVFNNPTQKMSVVEKENFWKQLNVWLKKNSHIISVIVSPDFDEIENLINNVAIVKRNSSAFVKPVAEFIKKSTLKERVINEIVK
ncbi:MAG: hypothetical protein LBT85_01905 [Bifidobacteriaceae bacterium]|jgi:ABC-type uncharacterized transport system ATPase subunit|nr:hypothetical protein [Bifidobacteriaceae bacterium]